MCPGSGFRGGRRCREVLSFMIVLSGDSRIPGPSGSAHFRSAFPRASYLL